MCGIAGIYGSERETGPILTGMLARLEHRGPDDAGCHVERRVALGMRRLSIIDIEGGDQPVANEDGSVLLVFNGEIYNHRQLRNQLRAAGHRFTSRSDTEVIVHLYEEYGDDCLAHLRGMFAFALWDRHQERLLVARDRLGVKPLYWTQLDGELIFASEIKALLCHPAIRPAMDHEALGLYLGLKYVPAPRTLFRGINSLPPGHCLVARRGTIQTHRYWDLPFGNGVGPAGHRAEAEALEELDSLLNDSVTEQMGSDVPFGAFLSGGLDSSLVVALMRRNLTNDVRTFSIGFETEDGDSADELGYARQVARELGAVHQEVRMGARQFVEEAHRVIYHLDQPIADQSTVATHLLSGLAAREVKMVLTGEGGDELFAGYARYPGEAAYPLARPFGPLLRGVTPALSDHLPGLRREKIALYALSHSDEGRRFANWFPLFDDRRLQQLLSPDLRERTLPGGAADLFRDHLKILTNRDAVQRLLYVDNKLWLPDFLLLRGDKLTMSNSLEARVPLLDHRLVEFAARLPRNLKVRGRERKYLLRRAASRYLPSLVLERPKQGFPMPIARWFRQDARSFLHDLLDPHTVRRRGLFDPGYIQRLLSQHDKGFADHSIPLWGLASIELWQQIFIDNQAALPEPAAAQFRGEAVV